MAQYRAHYPILPNDLLALITRITGFLLVPRVYTTLIAILANNNLEMFEYMLKRTSIFRDIEPKDLEKWDGYVCLKLLDSNWACFSESVEKAPTEAMESRTLASSDASSPSTGRTQAGSAGVSSSRWASSSSSSFRRSASGPNLSGAASATPTFHPSKLSALASSLNPASDPNSAQAVLKWSPARWSVLLEDLEGLLCKTCVLPEVEERRRARIWIDTWKSNVASWKS